MKNPSLIILGILVLVASFFTGPLGILISLTGLGVPPVWLQLLLLALGIIALLSLKQVINRAYRYFGSDKILYYFLSFTVVSFLIRNFYKTLLVNRPMEFIAFLIFLVTPIVALMFFASLLKAKKFWISFYGMIGIIISVIGIIEQGILLSLVYILEPAKYGYVAAVGKMIGGAFVSYIKMFQNWILGGILIWGAFFKAGKK